MLSFQKERFSDILEELPEIFYRHWEEVALDRTVITLDPDWERYAQLDKMNQLHMMTVRDDGVLIGYFLAFVWPHIHYKSSMTAWSDIFYLMPEYRFGWTGYKLFKHAEKMLKVLGVQKSYVMTKRHIPLNMLMKRLGYRLIEKVYTRLL